MIPPYRLEKAKGAAISRAWMLSPENDCSVAGVLGLADGALDAATYFLRGPFGLHVGTADNLADSLTGFATGNVAGATGLVDRASFHVFWIRG